MYVLNKEQQELIRSVDHFTKATVNNICKGRFRNIIADIHQEALLAVCKATLSYDASSPVAFTTYLYPHIVYAVQKSVREYGFAVRIPQHAEGLATVVHLHTTVDDDGKCVGDEILDGHQEEGSDEILRQTTENEKVDFLFSLITKQEQRIIRGIFGFDGKAMSFQALAKKLKLSPIKIRQAYNNAIIKMENGAMHYKRRKKRCLPTEEIRMY